MSDTSSPILTGISLKTQIQHNNRHFLALFAYLDPRTQAVIYTPPRGTLPDFSEKSQQPEKRQII